MAVSRKLKKQLEALGDQMIPNVRNAFIASIRDVTDTSMLNAIIDAIREGDLEKAFRATGLSSAAMRPVTSMIETAFEQGGVFTSNSLPRLNTAAGPTIFRFDVRNSRAEAWLRDQSSGLVTRINEQTRTNIQTIVQAGMVSGRNPRNVALDIIGRVDPDTGRRTGGIVGLTDAQARWVANARAELSDIPNASYFSRERRDKRFDGIVRKAIKDGKPLDPGKVDALIGKYSDNLLQLRGETIARTEMLQALAKSQDEAIRQAIDTGTIDPSAVTKKWDATGDARTRPSHRAMDGQAVRMDEAFTTPDGHKMLIPGDSSLGAPGSEVINCRCRVDYDVDFLAGLEDEYKPAPDVPPVPAPPPPAPPAPPPVPSVPRMPYEDYVPVRSITEAEEYSRVFLAQNVAFTKGVKLPGLNDILKASQEVIDRFGLPKMRYMGDPKGDDRRWKFNPKAIASFGMQSDTFLFRNFAADIGKIEEAMGANPAQALRNLEIARANNASWIDPRVHDGLKRMTTLEWSVTSNSREITYHEMGHRFDGFFGDEIRRIQMREGADWLRGGWPYLISRYSATNTKEYIAECFALYMKGDENEFWRIHPRLLEFFQEKDQKHVRT